MTSGSPLGLDGPRDPNRGEAGMAGSRVVVLADLDVLRAAVADAVALRLSQFEARLAELVASPARGEGPRVSPDALLNEHEVSVRLGLSGRTIRRLESAGEFPAALRLGSSKRWRPEDVEQWLARHQRRG